MNKNSCKWCGADTFDYGDLYCSKECRKADNVYEKKKLRA